MEKELKNAVELKTGFFSSLFLTILTTAGFGFAMIAIPPSGPYCPGNCMGYPYTDILKYFPRDYYWMYITVFQLIAFLIFVIANHYNASEKKKILSCISVSLAIISSTVLLADYFIQFSVVPISMIKGEVEGIPLLTQYNGNGIFIALEELGFFIMSLAFLFLSPVYNGKNRVEKVLQWLLVIPFICILTSFVYYTLSFGINRDYRFEVAAITVNWLAAIVIGIVSCFYFYKKMRLSERGSKIQNHEAQKVA